MASKKSIQSKKIIESELFDKSEMKVLGKIINVLVNIISEIDIHDKFENNINFLTKNKDLIITIKGKLDSLIEKYKLGDLKETIKDILTDSNICINRSVVGPLVGGAKNKKYRPITEEYTFVLITSIQLLMLLLSNIMPEYITKDRFLQSAFLLTAYTFFSVMFDFFVDDVMSVSIELLRKINVFLNKFH